MAGTVTITRFERGVMEVSATGDATTGSFPATDLIASAISDGLYADGLWPSQQPVWLDEVGVKIGGTAPTDSWDFTLTDQHGIDVLGGAGADMSNSEDAYIKPLVGNSTAKVRTSKRIDMASSLTLNISGNSVASAVITFIFLFHVGE